MCICFLHPFITTSPHLKPFSGFFSSTKSLSPRSLAYDIIASKVPPQHHKYTVLWLHNINSRLNRSNSLALPPHVLSCVNTILYWSLMPQYSCVPMVSPLPKILLPSSFIWFPLFHSFPFFHYIPVYLRVIFSYRFFQTLRLSYMTLFRGSITILSSSISPLTHQMASILSERLCHIYH